MSLSKDVFDKAKQKAFDRLTFWAAEIKTTNQDNGIHRLQENFKHIFKKIEWRKRGKRKVLYPQEKEETETKKETEIIKKAEPPTSAEPLDDYRRHDSNSSNVSSRVDTDKEISDIVLNKPRKSTLGPKKSLSPVNVLQTTLTDKLHTELEHESIRRLNERTSTNILPLMHRRKRKRKEKKQVAPPAAQLSGTAPTTVTIKVEGSSEDTEGGKRLSLDQGSRRRPTSKIGLAPLELVVLKRNLKHARLKIEASKEEVIKQKEQEQLQQEKPSDEERKKKVLANFRRIVRHLIHVRVLLNVARFRMEEEEKEKMMKGFKFDDGREMKFDATVYKTAVTSYGGLNSRARQALKKNPRERDEDDARILMDVMFRLPIFAKYPVKVKQDLAKMLWYDRFREGRVIVKQGDPGSRMYFVLSGPGVSLRRTDRFDKDGNPISYQYQSIGVGSTFGELALIREMKRDYTAVCIGTSEFLSLSKLEFNTVLRNRWEKECNIRLNFLKHSKYFSTWTEKQIQACADTSDLKDYPDNRVILGNTSGLTDNVYFIRRGRCEIVRRIMIVKRNSPYLRSTILLPNMARRRPDFLDKPYGRSLRSMSDEYIYLTITILETGSYFGVGEDLTDTYIVAKGKTECVIVNSAQFSIQGKKEMLRKLKNQLQSNLPTNTEMYRQFQINRKWFAYRKKLVKEIAGKRKCYVNKSDVPLSLRNEPTIHLNT